MRCLFERGIAGWLEPLQRDLQIAVRNDKPHCVKVLQHSKIAGYPPAVCW